MAGLADNQVREALAALASRSRPPAAGVASAFAAAAAAALVELTAGLAADRVAAEGPGVAATPEAGLRALGARAGEIRELLLTTADEDVDAYAAVIDARDAASRARALARASEPPLAIAQFAADVAEAAAEIARAGTWAFRADAVVAAELAAAASRGAACLVATNLAAQADDPRPARAQTAADRAERASRATGPAPH